MNIDIDSQFPFGDAVGLRQFLLVHRFVHQSYQDALQAQYGQSFSTFGLNSQSAEQDWIESMEKRRRGSETLSLSDWLSLHASLHAAEYAVIGGTGNVPPDLSTVDFADPQQFADWMNTHQIMHDYTNQQLGIP